MSADTPDSPDERIPQDPGIPGFDTIAEEAPPPLDEKDEAAELRERDDDVDEEGHMTAGGEPNETSRRLPTSRDRG